MQVDCCICGVDNQVMPCTDTGASCDNVTISCMATTGPTRSLGCAHDPSGANAGNIISALTSLGTTVAGAVTGRPVITNAQGGVSLGNKPLVTGQIQASSVMVVVGIALVLGVVVIMTSRKG